MRSLFVVSLPRSLSTRVYHLARAALGLAEPTWTSDGEILNFDRYTCLPEAGPFDLLKFTHPERRAEQYEGLVALLGQAARPHGFAYKDVVQPFVTAAWLPASGCKVLKIERPLAEVAHNMLARSWLYPAQAANGAAPGSERALVEGLARAREALAALPGVAVRFDDLVSGEEALAAALSKLYDGAPVPVPPYLDETFRNIRGEVLARRETEGYRRIAALCRELRPRLTRGSGRGVGRGARGCGGHPVSSVPRAAGASARAPSRPAARRRRSGSASGRSPAPAGSRARRGPRPPAGRT